MTDAQRAIRDRIVNELVRSFDEVTAGEELPDSYRDAFEIRIEGDDVVARLDYVIDGKPVGLWFEHGTSDHWVEPKVLHPRGGVREGRQRDKIEKRDNPAGVQSPQALSWVSGGQRWFSRGHMVRGIEAKRIFYRTIERFKNKMAGSTVVVR